MAHSQTKTTTTRWRSAKEDRIAGQASILNDDIRRMPIRQDPHLLAREEGSSEETLFVIDEYDNPDASEACGVLQHAGIAHDTEKFISALLAPTAPGSSGKLTRWVEIEAVTIAFNR